MSSEPDVALQRLHPLSPALRSVRLLAVAVAAISWRGLQDFGFTRWLMVVGVLAVGVAIYSVLAWRFTGYAVVGRELRIHDGLLRRRVRTVPLERLQSIEVVQPVLARLAGLAELRLDVAGAAKSEAPLAFLPVAEANALRAQLLSLAAGERTAVGTTEPTAAGRIDAAHGGAGETSARETGAEPTLAPAGASALTTEADEPVFQVDNKAVLVSQALTPSVMFTPLAVLYVVGQLMFNSNFGLFAIASMVTAIAGTIGQPAMRVLNFWNFRLATTPDPHSPDGYRLHIRHGLLETRSQTVHPRRIQSLTITWPLLWRRNRWLRVTLAVAGQSSVGEGEGKAETDRLLPVADLDTARAVIPLAVPGVDITALPLQPVPEQARWLAPIRRPVLAAGLAETVFATVDGRVTRQLTVVPYARIQSVRVVQGPLQRRLGLATLYVDVAGASPAAAPHRSIAQAYAWADELAERARAARAAGRDAGQRRDV